MFQKSKVKMLNTVFLLTLCIMLLFTSKGVLAFQINDYQTVDSDKIWTIKFTGQVGFDDLTKQNIVVKDSKGNNVNVSMDLQQDNKSIVVNPPESGYAAGESYTLTIGQKVHSQDGVNMKQQRVLHFNIGNKIISIDDINITLNQNDSYSLPKTVKAKISDGSSKDVSVTWDKKVDTSKSGTTYYYGTVQGYSKKVNLILTVNESSSGKELTTKQIVNLYGKAVVYVEVQDSNHKVLGSGSGFIVTSDGTVVTNFHVIDGAAYATVTLQNGTKYDVEGVLNYNKTQDIAILKLKDASNLDTIILGDSSKVELADNVVAIGSPKGYDNTISIGIISGLNRDNGRGYGDIQMTASITHGSSGGALFNTLGEVIGITYAGYDTAGDIGFAIPINEAKAFLQNTSNEKTLLEVNNISSNAKPAAPTGVTAWGVSSDSIALQWDSVKGVDGYYIYYSEDGYTWNCIEDSNGNKILKQWGTGYSGGLKGLSSGQKIYFKVTSVKNGIESDDSTVVNATSIANTKPAAPKGVTVWGLSSDSIAIQWNQVDAIDGYYVYYSGDGSNWLYWDNDDGSKKLLQWRSGNSAILSGISAGQKIYFKVTSVKNGVESNDSNVASATTYYYGSKTSEDVKNSDVPKNLDATQVFRGKTN